MKINIVQDETRTTLEEQERRQEICNNCPFYIEEKDSCSSCNCLIARKKLYQSDTCPEGRWL